MDTKQAFSILEQGLNMASKNGTYTLREATLVQTAFDSLARVFNVEVETDLETLKPKDKPNPTKRKVTKKVAHEA